MSFDIEGMKRTVESLRLKADEDHAEAIPQEKEFLRGLKTGYEGVEFMLKAFDSPENKYQKGWLDGMAALLKDLKEEENRTIVDLPVIPQYISEFIESYKVNYDLCSVFHDAHRLFIGKPVINKYITDNQETFARAWMDGYTVEEEPLYQVVLEENDHGAVGLGIGKDGVPTFAATDTKSSLPKLTEQEIKDYDERYWPFRKLVKDVD